MRVYSPLIHKAEFRNKTNTLIIVYTEIYSFIYFHVQVELTKHLMITKFEMGGGGFGFGL